MLFEAKSLRGRASRVSRAISVFDLARPNFVMKKPRMRTASFFIYFNYLLTLHRLRMPMINKKKKKDDTKKEGEADAGEEDESEVNKSLQKCICIVYW